MPDARKSELFYRYRTHLGMVRAFGAAGPADPSGAPVTVSKAARPG
jgi:hypothetical protein